MIATSATTPNNAKYGVLVRFRCRKLYRLGQPVQCDRERSNSGDSELPTVCHGDFHDHFDGAFDFVYIWNYDNDDYELH
jgi:hypothetical protein